MYSQRLRRKAGTVVSTPYLSYVSPCVAEQLLRVFGRLWLSAYLL